MIGEHGVPPAEMLGTTNALVREICIYACQSHGQCRICKIWLLRESIDFFEDGHTIKQAVKLAIKKEDIAYTDIRATVDGKYDRLAYSGGEEI